MSYELKIDPKSRAAGRFIGKVRKALVLAAIEEKKETKISQQAIAKALGVNRSVVNRILKGETNLTLRTLGEIAWALGREPEFTLAKKAGDKVQSNQFDPIQRLDSPNPQPSSRAGTTFYRSKTPQAHTRVPELAR